MKATVKILRSDGRRRADRDIQSQAGTIGMLTMATVEGSIELKLYDPNDSQLKPLIPPLWDARLVAMRGNRMLFQGLTARWGDGGVAQEWSVEVMA